MGFFIGILFDQEIETNRVICLSEQNDLLDAIDSVSKEYSINISTANSRNGCSEQAMNITINYQTNIFSFMKEDDNFHELLKQNNIQTTNKSVQNKPNLTLGASVGFILGLICGFYFLRSQRKKGIFVKRPKPANTNIQKIQLTLVSFFGLVFFVWLPFQLLYDQIKIPNYLILDTDSLQLGYTLWVFIVLIAPFTEEILFRAWLLEAWKRIIGPPLALLLSSIAFSIFHPMGLIANILFIIPGLILGGLWLKTQSLTACVIAHSMYNAFVLCMLHFTLQT